MRIKLFLSAFYISFLAFAKMGTAQEKILKIYRVGDQEFQVINFSDEADQQNPTLLIKEQLDSQDSYLKHEKIFKINFYFKRDDAYFLWSFSERL